MRAEDALALAKKYTKDTAIGLGAVQGQPGRDGQDGQPGMDGINGQDGFSPVVEVRRNATDYITDLIHAAMWFSNMFHGTSYNIEETLNVEFDDSYVEDKQTKIESMRADAVTFSDIPILLVWYLMERYNLSEEEARKHLEQKDNTEEEMEE